MEREREDASMRNIPEIVGHDEIATENDLELELKFTGADNNLVSHRFKYEIIQRISKNFTMMMVQ